MKRVNGVKKQEIFMGTLNINKRPELWGGVWEEKLLRQERQP